MSTGEADFPSKLSAERVTDWAVVWAEAGSNRRSTPCKGVVIATRPPAQEKSSFTILNRFEQKFIY